MSSLLKAITSRENEKAKSLLSSNPSLLNSPLEETSGKTILHYIANNGNVELLNFILSGTWHTNSNVQLNLDKQANDGITPLHEAVNNSQIGIIQLLLTAGADPNLRDGQGRTPLHWASEKGDQEIACLLINGSKKTNVNEQDLFGRTALHWAAKKELLELLNVLFKHENLNINSQTKGGETSLHWASLEGHSKIVEMLIKKGADINIKNNGEQLAIDITNSDSVKKLLQQEKERLKALKGENYYAPVESENTAVVKNISKQPPAKKTLKITLKK